MSKHLFIFLAFCMSFLLCNNLWANQECAHRNRNYSKNVHLALTKVCISEAGFQVQTNDCRLIYDVLRDRNQRMFGEYRLTMRVMRYYSTNVFNRQRRDARPWLPFLQHDGERPRFWPERVLPWSIKQEGFKSVYQFVGKLLRNEESFPTSTIPAHHWGAKRFQWRTRRRMGWIPLPQCITGRTLNRFWTVPSLIEPENRVCEMM